MAPNSAKSPGSCEHQINGNVKPNQAIGGSGFSQTCLCGLKCTLVNNKLLPTSNSACTFKGDELNCPVFKMGTPTTIDD